jgi:hypothetical protein
MKYKLLSSTSASILEKSVNRNLENGWEVQGGVCCVPGKSNDLVAQKDQLVQAMIARGDVEDD